jgi:uncharacterized membrane protein YkoI
MAFAAGGVQAHTEKDGDQDFAIQALRRGEILPLNRILALATRRVPGDVLKVKLERRRGEVVYEVKILERSGRVQELHLNARSGAVLAVEAE